MITVLGHPKSGTHLLSDLIREAFGVEWTLVLNEAEDRDITWKTHSYCPDLLVDSPLVLLLRNYKECIPSWFSDRYEVNINNFKRVFCSGKLFKADYIGLCQSFIGHQGPKCVVYYEDLVTCPSSVVWRLAALLGDAPKPVNMSKLFKDSIKNHEGQCYSPGTDIFFHSRKLDPALRRDMDEYLASNWKEIFASFLARYKESNPRQIGGGK